jgi:hypothetical protein
MAEQDNTQVITDRQKDAATMKARLKAEYGLDIEAHRKSMSEQPAQRLEWQVDQLAFDLKDHERESQKARNYREIAQKMQEYRNELKAVQLSRHWIIRYSPAQRRLCKHNSIAPATLSCWAVTNMIWRRRLLSRPHSFSAASTA